MTSKGSHTVWGGWESRECEFCGATLALNTKKLEPRYQHLFFSRFGGPGGTPVSRHFTCPPTNKGP
jgi:hypothetical protein